MVQTPWKAFAKPNPARDYVAVVPRWRTSSPSDLDALGMESEVALMEFVRNQPHPECMMVVRRLEGTEILR